MDNTVIVAIVAGLAAILGAVIAQIGEGIRQRRKRKYEKSDGKDKELQALRDGLKWVLYDRVRYLGQKYIQEGSVDFDDRRILNLMHKSYHDGLGGNGDLDVVMKMVNALPLKTTQKMTRE